MEIHETLSTALVELRDLIQAHDYDEGGNLLGQLVCASYDAQNIELTAELGNVLGGMVLLDKKRIVGERTARVQNALVEILTDMIEQTLRVERVA